MVSYETLLHINLHLAEIKNIASPSIYFGGLNILVFGDFLSVECCLWKFSIFSIDSVWIRYSPLERFILFD